MSSNSRLFPLCDGLTLDIFINREIKPKCTINNDGGVYDSHYNYMFNVSEMSRNPNIDIARVYGVSQLGKIIYDSREDNTEELFKYVGEIMEAKEQTADYVLNDMMPKLDKITEKVKNDIELTEEDQRLLSELLTIC